MFKEYLIGGYAIHKKRLAECGVSELQNGELLLAYDEDCLSLAEKGQATHFVTAMLQSARLSWP